MTEPAIAYTTPVFTIDGELVREMARDCVRLETDHGVDGLKTLRVHLNALGPTSTGPPTPMQYLDGDKVDFGRRIQVAAGPDGRQRFVFDGVVSALEAVHADAQAPLVIVSAEDALMRLRMTRRSRTYRKTTNAQIASDLASEHGLRAITDADGPRHDVVQQVNQSDLAFLRERARLIGAELWCEGSEFHFATRTRRAGTTLTLVQGNDLLAVRVCADLAHQRSAVTVTGYDATTASVIDESVGVEAIAAEAHPGRTGIGMLEKALGPSTSIRVREGVRTAAEARALATAELLRRARGFVSVVGVTRGSPDMIVGSILHLQLVGGPFEGDGYYVTRVQHTFDLTRGFRTRFEAERATVNGAT